MIYFIPTMDQIIRSILGLETTHELHGNLKVFMEYQCGWR